MVPIRSVAYSSLPRAELHLCSWHPLAWLLGGRLHVASTRPMGCQQSAKLSSVLRTSAAYEAQDQSFCFLLFHSLPQMPFLRSGWLIGFVKGRECCAMEQVLPAPTVSHCLVPSTASCAGIFSSPAAVLGAGESSCTQLLFSWGGNSPGPAAITAASILLEGGVVGPCLHWIFSFGHPVTVGYIPDARHLAQIAYTDCLKYLCLCSKVQKCLSFEKELCSRVFVKLW